MVARQAGGLAARVRFSVPRQRTLLFWLWIVE